MQNLPVLALSERRRFCGHGVMPVAQSGLEGTSGLLNVRQPLRCVLQRMGEQLSLPFGAHAREASAAEFPLLSSHSSISFLTQATGEVPGEMAFFSPSLCGPITMS